MDSYRKHNPSILVKSFIIFFLWVIANSINSNAQPTKPDPNALSRPALVTLFVLLPHQNEKDASKKSNINPEERKPCNLLFIHQQKAVTEKEKAVWGGKENTHQTPPLDLVNVLTSAATPTNTKGRRSNVHFAKTPETGNKEEPATPTKNGFDIFVDPETPLN